MDATWVKHSPYHSGGNICAWHDFLYVNRHSYNENIVWLLFFRSIVQLQPRKTSDHIYTLYFVILHQFLTPWICFCENFELKLKIPVIWTRSVLKWYNMGTFFLRFRFLTIFLLGKIARNLDMTQGITYHSSTLIH